MKIVFHHFSPQTSEREDNFIGENRNNSLYNYMFIDIFPKYNGQ